MFGSEQTMLGGKYVMLPVDLATAMMRCYYGNGPRASEGFLDDSVGKVNLADDEDDDRPQRPRRPTTTMTYEPGAMPRKGYQWIPANDEVNDAGTAESTE